MRTGGAQTAAQTSQQTFCVPKSAVLAGWLLPLDLHHGSRPPPNPAAGSLKLRGSIHSWPKLNTCPSALRIFQYDRDLTGLSLFPLNSSLSNCLQTAQTNQATVQRGEAKMSKNAGSLLVVMERHLDRCARSCARGGVLRPNWSLHDGGT